jgi:hypothetical protein
MADNSKKVSELPTASNAALTDRILILRSPAANASVRTITANDFINSFQTDILSVIPDTVVVANSITAVSNGTTEVPFFSYQVANGKTGCCELTIHARDATTDSTTAGKLLIVANTSSVSSSVTSIEVGDNQILLTPNPVQAANIITLYFTRSSATTSNVLIRYSATIF